MSQLGFQKEAHAAPKRFKAAYSAIIMAVFWVTKGAETFQHLGKLAGFDFDISSMPPPIPANRERKWI